MRKKRNKDGTAERFENVEGGKVRILQITAFCGWGCTGRIALGIHNVLVEQEQQSIIAWGRINTAPDTVPTIKIGNKLDQQVHGLYTRITDKCGYGSKYVTKKFIKEIDKYTPDLIQLHILHGYYINLPILFEYIKEKKIPVVWTFHDCWAFTGHCPYFDLVGCQKWETGCYQCQQKHHHPASWIVDNSKGNWLAKKKLFTAIDNLTIVTPSEWLAKLVKKSFLQGCRIEVIHNGIDTQDFKPVYGDIFTNMGISNKKIILGVSSTWSNSKGLKDFIQLNRILPDEYIVVLVGVTKDQKRKLPKTIIGIERTENISELAELYTAATVLVNPTYEDNYPTINLEALACGTPVITYKTGGSIEAIEQSGYGYIVNKGDIGGLLRSILEIPSKDKATLGSLMLDQKIIFNKYVKLYHDIVKK